MLQANARRDDGAAGCRARMMRMRWPWPGPWNELAINLGFRLQSVDNVLPTLRGFWAARRRLGVEPRVRASLDAALRSREPASLEE